MSISDEATARFRGPNDAIRTSGLGGTVLITRGISHLDESLQQETIVDFKSFDDFTPDKDPCGQRDFGAFVVKAPELY